MLLYFIFSLWSINILPVIGISGQSVIFRIQGTHIQFVGDVWVTLGSFGIYHTNMLRCPKQWWGAWTEIPSLQFPFLGLYPNFILLMLTSLPNLPNCSFLYNCWGCFSICQSNQGTCFREWSKGLDNCKQQDQGLCTYVSTGISTPSCCLDSNTAQRPRDD